MTNFAALNNKGIAIDGAVVDAAFASLDGNASATTATAAGSSVARTLAIRSSDVIWAEDYGFVGDGANDDGVAIQAAHDAAPVGALIRCRGTSAGSLITTPVVLSKSVTFATRQQFLINTAITAFTLTGESTEIVGPRFQGNRTAGSICIATSGNKCRVAVIRSRDMGWTFKTLAGGYESVFSHLDIRNAVHGAAWLYDGTGPQVENLTYDTDGAWYGGTKPSPDTAGILIQCSGSVLRNVDVIHGGISGGLWLLPDAGSSTDVAFTHLDQCEFDSTDGPAMHITGSAASGKRILGTKIVNGWGSASRYGVLIDGDGVVDGVDVNACDLLTDWGDAAIYVGNATAKNVRFDGNNVVAAAGAVPTGFTNVASTNPCSIFISCPNVVVIRGGSVQGSEDGFIAPPKAHIELDAAGVLDIDGVKFDRNVQTQMVVNGAAGQPNLTVGRCIGLNTRWSGVVHIAAAASSVTVTPTFAGGGGFDVPFTVADFTVTPLTAPGGTNVQWWVDPTTISQTSFTILTNAAVTSAMAFAVRITTRQHIDYNDDVAGGITVTE